MAHMTARRYVVASYLLLLALLIAGCQVEGTITVLRNPAPSVLDVSMWVTFDRRAEDADTRVDVELTFLSGGHTVQFAGDERVTCDGVDLPVKDRVAVLQVLQEPAAQAAAGATIDCDYAAGGSVASVSLQIPPAPEITSPQVGAQVVRGAQTHVTYRCDPATCAELGVVAFAPSSPKAIAVLNTPGPQQATVDTSGFAPGPGSLVLTASLAPHLTQTGAPFKSASASGSATALAAVTWV